MHFDHAHHAQRSACTIHIDAYCGYRISTPLLRKGTLKIMSHICVHDTRQLYRCNTLSIELDNKGKV